MAIMRRTARRIEKSRASQIATEINNYIFLPARKCLERLYEVEMKPSAMAATAPTTKKSVLAEKNKTAEKTRIKTKDRYREIVE